MNDQPGSNYSLTVKLKILNKKLSSENKDNRKNVIRFFKPKENFQRYVFARKFCLLAISFKSSQQVGTISQKNFLVLFKKCTDIFILAK